MIFAPRAVDSHAVRLAVANATGHPQIDGNFLHARAGQIIDNGVVGAAQRRELNTLDTVEVHRDRAEVTKERCLFAICRNGGVLGEGRRR